MLSEQVRVHENFGSTHLAAPRNVLIYLPPGYGEDASRRYPVLYMHDGQNLIRAEDAFGGIVWGVDETAQQLILAGLIEPLIIVGIYNAGAKRIDEYTPVKSDVGRMRGHGGKADFYGRMIIEELKPFIDAEYLTKPEREFTG
jgi:predicted alpha/beta superfamily hydrolase